MDVACLIDILKKMGVFLFWWKRNGYKTFNCEDEACKYLLKVLENEMKN